MSHENVEIVRAAIDAWNRGDWDAAFTNVAPDIEFDTGDHVVSRETGTFRGRDGIEVTVRSNFLWRLRDGVIAHVVSYRELEGALGAAGLRE